MAKKKKLTPKEIATRMKEALEDVKLQRAEADMERVEELAASERKMRSAYERDKKELAPWIGWEEYREARKSEARIKAVGIIGAYMSGKKRDEIRKLYRISPNKLNEILNSKTVDDILSYSLGHIYSFQTAAVQAIMHELQKNHNGYLAMALLGKMGLFKRMEDIAGSKVETGGDDGQEDFIGVLLSKGKPLQARQATEALGKLVVDAFKAQSSDGE